MGTKNGSTCRILRLQRRGQQSNFFCVHPPVLSSAPFRERGHGVHNGLTCWSVCGVSRNIPQFPSRSINNHQGMPSGHEPAVRRLYLTWLHAFPLGSCVACHSIASPSILACAVCPTSLLRFPLSYAEELIDGNQVADGTSEDKPNHRGTRIGRQDKASVEREGEQKAISTTQQDCIWASATQTPHWGIISYKWGQQIGGALLEGFQHGSWQHSFPVTWISVPGPKHTFSL